VFQFLGAFTEWGELHPAVGFANKIATNYITEHNNFIHFHLLLVRVHQRISSYTILFNSIRLHSTNLLADIIYYRYIAYFEYV